MKAVDLFAGAGGWSLACQNLDIDEVGIDFMPQAIATRRANGLESIEADITQLKPFGGDILIASPPCQPFSQANWNAGVDKEKMALTYAILEWAPLFDTVVMENVKKAMPDFQEIRAVLREMGFRNTFVAKLNSEQYGTPQARQRVVLIASKKAFEDPVATHSQYHRWTPSRLDTGVVKWNSLAQALPHRTDLPAWAHVRPSPTIVGSYHPEVIAAPGYRKPGDTSRQNTPDSVVVTVPEAGVIQDFPVDYKWQGSRTKQFLQVGNAIPVKMAEAILRTVI